MFVRNSRFFYKKNKGCTTTNQSTVWKKQKFTFIWQKYFVNLNHFTFSLYIKKLISRNFCIKRVKFQIFHTVYSKSPLLSLRYTSCLEKGDYRALFPQKSLDKMAKIIRHFIISTTTDRGCHNFSTKLTNVIPTV